MFCLLILRAEDEIDPLPHFWREDELFDLLVDIIINVVEERRREGYLLLKIDVGIIIRDQTTSITHARMLSS